MKTKIVLFFAIGMLISCMNPQPRKPVSIKTVSEDETSILLNKSIIKNEEAVFKALMAKDSLTAYIASPNGFWYTYNVKSTNLQLPEVGDKILYTFDVFNVENNLIYGAQEIGLQSYVVDKQELLEGLRNGLKLMHEGDVVTFLFPSHKVYGYAGDQNKIGINQSLIYKVQLIKINKKNESN
ncbi:gliding motility-associated peptidyl-prolyl isomerase GldI [Lutibacter sp. HS1-25]|uniref:gliding motility-associated peptidyl-prolyl isomerase GldI n=1 Tax=Lutibacter sp. HS1-25 TaxID=2485000 RepID=UPI001011BA4A|nr:gliding motility-associated peptidyl-prolyl isomerase GldI [Lutibacter sp. HS1-25]RXP47063.1 gliding motility-associated peptidyl-prolyl isomerase GldI [Lutibacter sp. HS1-25]